MASTSLKAKLDRVKEEFEKSVKQMRDAAGADVKRLEQDYEKYQALRKRVAEEVIRPRLEEVAAQFPGVTHKLARDIDGATLVLSFPRSPERSATVEIRLSIGHDDSFENVLFSYELSIIPVFVQFEKHSHLLEPLDRVDLVKVEAWLDQVLTAFAKTYLNMQFVEQHQRGNMATDPVLNRRFPVNLSAGSVEHDGVQYQFASAESKRLFESDPEGYLRMDSSVRSDAAAAPPAPKQTTELKGQAASPRAATS